MQVSENTIGIDESTASAKDKDTVVGDYRYVSTSAFKIERTRNRDYSAGQSDNHTFKINV